MGKESDNMIKVSVVVPVYNKSKEIRKCLNSLVKQTLKQIEIIVVNDASTDNSKEIILNYKKKYKNIIYIENKKNLGIGATRNKGILKAKGEYIGFVDADDYVDSRMYEKYYDFAVKNNLSFVTGNYYKINSKVKYLFETPYFEISNIKENPNLLVFDDYGPCNKMFLRSMIIDKNILFEEKLKYEDMPFVCKALLESSKVGHIKKSYYYYRIHEGSETTTMDSRVYDIFSILDIVNKYANKKKVNKEIIEYLNIMQITRYMLRQKYQIDKNVRKKFIEDGYKYLNENYPSWKDNKLYKEENVLKRIVKNNKILTNIYCLLIKK